MPMSPMGTRLANARGVPPRIAVPQSGPITRSSRWRASSFSAISSSSETLSLNIMTWSPALRAFRASAAAKSPGTEISARLALGSTRNAERNVRGCTAALAARTAAG